MFSRHPVDEDFIRFLAGTSRSEGSMQVVRHLLGECSDCRDKLSEMGWGRARLERLLYLSSSKPEAVPPSCGYDYGAAFAKADRALTAMFTPAQPLGVAVERLAEELTSLPGEDQLRRAAEDSRFAKPQLVQFLIDRGHLLRYQDPERMLNLNKLALLAAQACTAEVAGGKLRLADLRARAWGHFANALRICARLREAEEAFTRANQECEAGTGDPPLRASLLEQLSSLRIHQRRFEEAVDAAEAAGHIYRELGDSHLLATCLIRKANANVLAGEPGVAVDLINRAIPLIDCETDPQLLLAACHNLVRCFIDLSQPEHALSIYAETRDLYREFDDPLILLRAHWQEGQLLRDMGHPQQAESRLLEAQKGFLDRGLVYEAAILALDLAALYLTTGASEDVRQTAAAAVPIFRSLGVDRDALASLRQLQQVSDRDQAIELIRFLNARIEPLAGRGQVK